MVQKPAIHFGSYACELFDKLELIEQNQFYYIS